MATSIQMPSRTENMRLCWMAIQVWQTKAEVSLKEELAKSPGSTPDPRIQRCIMFANEMPNELLNAMGSIQGFDKETTIVTHSREALESTRLIPGLPYDHSNIEERRKPMTPESLSVDQERIGWLFRQLKQWKVAFDAISALEEEVIVGRQNPDPRVTKCRQLAHAFFVLIEPSIKDYATLLTEIQAIDNERALLNDPNQKVDPAQLTRERERIAERRNIAAIFQPEPICWRNWAEQIEHSELKICLPRKEVEPW